MNSSRSQARRSGRFKIFLWGTVLGLAILGGFGWVLASLKNLPSPDRIADRSVAESTKIYDRTGAVLLYEIHGEENRTVVRLSDISDAVKNATLAAEDLNFYHHPGIDWRGVLRAIFKNVESGSLSQGGSTITQQLVKNSLLGSEKTFGRKIKEAILAILLERKYSKDEILEMYLNQIPYGSNAYGVAAAAETFFGKEPKDLTLGEAATLAALPRAPTYYSPFGPHKRELLERRDWILNRMAENGLIQKDEAELAKKENVVFAPPKEAPRAPHFVMYVREYLNNKYGESFVEQGGLKVTTTLDWNLEQEAEKIVKEGAEQNEKSVSAFNAALVALDPKTGEILAMVGSRDYLGKPLPDGCSAGVNCKFDPYVNVALQERQPGSAFKPFVYATAFKKGYTPETVLFDAPTEFNPLCNPDGSPGPLIKDPKECYHPQDYDEKFRGPVNLRQALAQSLNVPSAKLLYLAGIKDSIQTAQDMGITTLNNPDRYGLSLVLGGAEVKLAEMVSAFGIFAQDGILHPQTSILRIENSQGDVLEEKKDYAVPALDTEVSRTINNILSDNEARVPIFSPTSSLYFPDRQIAAKTGTTQDSRDAWVIGYTPSLVAGVWAGNNDNSPMEKSALSIVVAGPVWHKFMEFALQNSPPEEFILPESESPANPVLRGSYRSGTTVRIDKISQKLATAYTPPELVEEESFGNAKTILASLNKDDPYGPPPADPAQDPQYKNWEAGVEQWLASHNLGKTEPPADYDNLHTPDKIPQINLISPADPTQAKNVKEITAEIKNAFPLEEVSLFLNDDLVGSQTQPFSSNMVSFALSDQLKTGVYNLKIAVYDSVKNKAVLEKELVVQ